MISSDLRMQKLQTACLAVCMLAFTVNTASAQLVQFPSTSASPPAWNGASSAPLFPAAPPANSGWAGVGTIQGPVGLGTTGNPALGTFPSTSGNVTYGTPTITPLGSPQFGFGNAPFGNSPYGNPALGAYPNNFGTAPNAMPPSLFPGYGSNSGFANPFGSAAGSTNSVFPNSWFNGNNWRLGSGWFNNGSAPIWNGSSAPEVIRFFQGPRFRHTWIEGDDEPNDVQINDSDVGLMFAVPRFFGSTQPLLLTPSFSSHLWEGPTTPTADLPGSAYSAFLDIGWQTDPVRTFGLESGIRVGVFTDYDTFNSESFRIAGKLVGRVRLTPNAVGRAGVYWLDRNRIKLLPAAGLTWTPNPDTRFDLFFPEPKLSHYLATLGRMDMWWYVTGYYGGGAWTITRADSTEDSIDINDIRVMLGLEFGQNQYVRFGQRSAFVEAGYSFNRELIYRIRPQDNLDIENSFILRAGIGY
jgi:hypothetical protein